MNLNELLTLGYWNSLVVGNLPEIVMVLTATLVVVLDRYVRKLVSKYTSSFNKVARFFVFLGVCSVGYTCIALGLAWGLREGFTFNGGLYSAPAVLGVLVLVSIEAQRQKQF